MPELLNLSPQEIGILGFICFCAGLVRGFSGFALSAFVMATAVTILPPVQLIPVLWFLEMSASLLMARGGWRDANRNDALLLVLGNLIGWPVGLWLTLSISTSASKITVLIIIVTLAISQLAKIRLAFLNAKKGALIAGVVAGIVSGLAHVGGMIVALFALSRDADPRTMRGTLVTYLFIASFSSFIYLLAFGVMEQTAMFRGLSMILPTVAGVWVGTKMFTPRFQPYYRPFCLSLLIGLALVTLMRQVL